jgi:hypothetical protein
MLGSILDKLSVQPSKKHPEDEEVAPELSYSLGPLEDGMATWFRGLQANITTTTEANASALI